MDASCLWLFKSSVNNSVLSDEVSGRNIHLEGGALITNTTERGLVVDTNGGWISLKETNGKFRRNDVNNCNKRVNSIKEKSIFPNSTIVKEEGEYTEEGLFYF